MILTCPECATRYFVEDERLGAAGRTVRCAGCGSAWKAQSEEPLELTAAAEEGALGLEPADAEKAAEAPAAAALPKSFRAKAEQAKRLREAAATGVVWGVMAAGFAVVLTCAYVFRVEIVKLYPRAAGAYAMAGVPVNPTGLEFSGVKAQPAPDNLAAVTVSGVIRNVENQAKATPPIRVALLDKTGAKIATRVLILSDGRISAGASRRFEVSLPDPKASAANVDVAFALDLMPKATPKPVVRTAAVTPRVTTTAQATTKTVPVKAATPTPPAVAAGLRPPIGVVTKGAVEATPLPSSDPYALDSTAPKKVSASPHG
jgi:predicted Zn finger-like uncharacterized protein